MQEKQQPTPTRGTYSTPRRHSNLFLSFLFSFDSPMLFYSSPIQKQNTVFSNLFKNHSFFKGLKISQRLKRPKILSDWAFIIFSIVYHEFQVRGRIKTHQTGRENQKKERGIDVHQMKPHDTVRWKDQTRTLLRSHVMNGSLDCSFSLMNESRPTRGTERPLKRLSWLARWNNITTRLTKRERKRERERQDVSSSS